MSFYKIKNETFTLDEMYNFESQLKLKYPSNNHIKDKIRQPKRIEITIFYN